MHPVRIAREYDALVYREPAARSGLRFGFRASWLGWTLVFRRARWLARNSAIASTG
jgi:hypothetical protein